MLGHVAFKGLINWYMKIQLFYPFASAVTIKYQNYKCILRQHVYMLVFH